MARRPDRCVHERGPKARGRHCPICDVGCPECHARPYESCKRPSEHEAAQAHVRRMVGAEFADSLCGIPYLSTEYEALGLPVPPFAIRPQGVLL